MKTNEKVLESISVDFLNFISFEIRKIDRWMNSYEEYDPSRDPDDCSFPVSYAEREILVKVIKEFKRIKKKNLKSPR